MGVNREAFSRLADVIEAEDPRRFTMVAWRYHASCGSVMCIGGWAEFLWEEDNPDWSARDHRDAAELFLGIAEDESSDWSALFFPFGYNRWGLYPRESAIALLRAVASGEVYVVDQDAWERFLPESNVRRLGELGRRT